MVKKQDTDVVLGYHEELSRHRFEAESKFDVAMVLVAGGAFTVSATLVPLPNKDGLVAAAWLGTAWIGWALCLLTSVGGYLFSAEGCSRRLKLLRAEAFDELQKSTWIERAIRPLNWLSFGALFVGFVAFGVFTLSNLNSGGTHGKGQKEGQEASQQQALNTSHQETDRRNERAGASTGISPRKDDKATEVKADERQATSTSATSATAPPAGRDREAGQRSTNAGLTKAAGQGDERARDATGVPQDTQAVKRQ